MITNWKELFQDNGIKVEKIIDRSYDPRGKVCTTITSGGVKLESAKIPTLYGSAEGAWKAFEDTLLTWLDGRRQVFLRKPPELLETTYFTDTIDGDWSRETYYVVYCRLTAY